MRGAKSPDCAHKHPQSLQKGALLGLFWAGWDHSCRGQWWECGWESGSHVLAVFPPQLGLLVQLAAQCLSELGVCLGRNNNKALPALEFAVIGTAELGKHALKPIQFQIQQDDPSGTLRLLQGHQLICVLSLFSLVVLQSSQCSAFVTRVRNGWCFLGFAAFLFPDEFTLWSIKQYKSLRFCLTAISLCWKMCSSWSCSAGRM